MLDSFHSFKFLKYARNVRVPKNMIFENLSQVFLVLPVTPDFERLPRGGVGRINPCPQLAIMALPKFSLMQFRPTSREIFDHLYPFTTVES